MPALLKHAPKFTEFATLPQNMGTDIHGQPEMLAGVQLVQVGKQCRVAAKAFTKTQDRSDFSIV